MSKSFISEARKFRNEMFWVSILLWIVAGIFIYFKSEHVEPCTLITIGAIITSLICNSMHCNIVKYEKLVKNES